MCTHAEGCGVAQFAGDTLSRSQIFGQKHIALNSREKKSQKNLYSSRDASDVIWSGIQIFAERSMSCLEKIVEYVRARSAITIVSAHGKMISGLTQQAAEVHDFFALYPLAHHHMSDCVHCPWLYCTFPCWWIGALKLLKVLKLTDFCLSVKNHYFMYSIVYIMQNYTYTLARAQKYDNYLYHPLRTHAYMHKNIQIQQHHRARGVPP